MTYGDQRGCPTLSGLSMLPDVGPWRKQAACKDHDNHLFFPNKGDRAFEAKRICSTCPVKAECLEFALLRPSVQGVWGGTTEFERLHMRRDRSIVAYKGNPPKFTQQIRERIVWLYTQDGWTTRQLARQFGCSRRTIARVLETELP